MVDNSVNIARILGPYLIIVGLGIMFNVRTYVQVLEDFLKNTALVCLGGIVALVFGLCLIQWHNVWVMDWPVLITLIGWMAVAKGAWIIVFPDTLVPAVDFCRKHLNVFMVRELVILGGGLMLTYFGYFAR